MKKRENLTNDSDDPKKPSTSMVDIVARITEQEIFSNSDRISTKICFLCLNFLFFSQFEGVKFRLDTVVRVSDENC